MNKSPQIPDNDISDEIEIADAIESCSTHYELMPNTPIRIAKEQYSVFEILRNIKRKTINIAPDFQRYNVWTDLQRSELIESIIVGIPIPMLYLFEDDNGNKQVIDGKQRLTTLVDFINGKFPLKHLKMKVDLNGYFFDDLEFITQSKIEDCNLQTYIIQPPTPEIVKYYIFDRINRGGTQLNQQEMRHALHHGKATNLLYELASDTRFNYFEIAKSDSNRMQKEYMVLRYLTINIYFKGVTEYGDLNNDINTLHSEIMKSINKLDDNVIDQINNFMLWSLYYSGIVLGVNAFRYNGSNKRTIISLFEIVLLIFDDVDVRNIINKENQKEINRIAKIINNHKDVIKENNALSSDYKSITALQKRLSYSKTIIKEILE